MLENLYMYRIDIYQFIIFFAIYSLFGWIIEVIFRSFTQKKFVNPGFLYGTFVPVYGISAISIIFFNSLIKSENILLQIIIYGLLATLIEYAIGLFSEKLFGLKLWDYSNSRFNYKGRICLTFSICWAVMAFIFVAFIHPVTYNFVRSIEEKTLSISAGLISIYFIADFTYSTISLKAFTEKVFYLYSEYLSLNNADIEKILKSFKRLLGAFPNLNKYLYENINDGLKKRINSFLNTIEKKFTGFIAERKPEDEEYYGIVKDILENEEFLKLKDYFHHNSSIFEHAKEVSYLSYSICKYLNLDYTSAGRGGLLHDFFLYDWRNHDLPDLAKEKFHGLEHPKIALENSERNFKMNETEKDIILKHMWPLTFIPPKYKEAFIVSFVDKYISSLEILDGLKKK